MEAEWLSFSRLEASRSANCFAFHSSNERNSGAGSAGREDREHVGYWFIPVESCWSNGDRGTGQTEEVAVMFSERTGWRHEKKMNRMP